MDELCICGKKLNVKCILNLCKKCCFAKTCSIHINNKKITKYNFICSICLLPNDKKLLNSFVNYEINETIYYCCQCYTKNIYLFNKIINKPFNKHVFNFDIPDNKFNKYLFDIPDSKINKQYYNIQIYDEHLYCACGCECFDTDTDSEMELYDDDCNDEYDDKIIFTRTDSPIEPATDKINECNICYINKKNYACIPCGHLCLCKVCASKITEKCPMCNIKITHITKIFS